MLVIGQCLMLAGVAGLGCEAFLWGASGDWLPTTVEDVYRSLGAYDLFQQADSFRAAASWYLETPIAALLLLYGMGLTLLASWRRWRNGRTWNAPFGLD